MPPISELPRRLSLADAIFLVVGTTIGGGIFMVPNLVARALPSAPWMIAVWIFTGALSCLGAMAYAELGAMIPATGGPYVFLREIYGSSLAFLCGWTYFFVIIPASAAWLSINFATYLGQFVTLTPPGARLVSLSLLTLVTAVNYCGVKLGSRVQKLLTVMKVAGMAVLILAAFATAAPARPVVAAAPVTVSGFGIAMIACLTAYDGWMALSAAAGEVRNPKRNLPLAALAALAVIVAIYTGVNLAYLRLLGVAGIAAADRVGAAAAGAAFGTAGAAFLSITVLVSILGSLTGWTFTGPRLLFAQASDGLIFRRLAAVHPRFETPYVSVIAIGGWSALLALTGTYESLAAYAMYATWMFYLLTAIGVLVLRRRDPARPRPYRMTGYPITLVLFALVAAGFILNTLITSPGPALTGTAIILAGMPVYFWWKKRV